MQYYIVHISDSKLINTKYDYGDRRNKKNKCLHSSVKAKVFINGRKKLDIVGQQKQNTLYNELISFCCYLNSSYI